MRPLSTIEIQSVHGAAPLLGFVQSYSFNSLKWSLKYSLRGLGYGAVTALFFAPSNPLPIMRIGFWLGATYGTTLAAISTISDIAFDETNTVALHESI